MRFNARASRAIGLPLAWLAVAACVVVLVAGCFGKTVSRADVRFDYKLAEIVTSIEVGATDRATLHATLGSPWLASAQWGFDVFRLSGASRGAYVFVALPVGYYSDEFTGFIFVTYDQRGIVTGADSRMVRADTSESFRAQDATMRLGDLRLYAFGEGGDASVAIHQASGERLASATGSVRGCELFLGCAPDSCPVRFALDDAGFVRFPDFHELFPSPLLWIRLPAGEHKLTVSSARPYLHPFDDVRQDFGCGAGDRVYLEIEWTRREDWIAVGAAVLVRVPLQVEVSVAREPPEGWAARPVTVYAKGHVVGNFEILPPRADP
jgi:hypothetical protein